MFYQWNQPLGSYSGLIQPCSCRCAQGSMSVLAVMAFAPLWDPSSICRILNGVQ